MKRTGKHSKLSDSMAVTTEAKVQSGGLIGMVSAGVIVLAILYGFSALFPTALNWGIHHFAFFPPPLDFLPGLLVIMILIPPLRSSLIDVVTRVIQFVNARSRIARFMLAAGGLTGVAMVFWQARERLFLLGDGALLVRSLPNVGATNEIPLSSSRNEPLALWVISSSRRLMSMLGISANNAEVYQYTSIACGIVWLVLLAMLVRRLDRDAINRVLVFTLIATSGFIQLFFGYAENYAPVMVGLLLFVLAAIGYLKGKVYLPVVGSAFGALLALHFAMIAMVPSMAFLLFLEIRRKKYLATVSAVVALIGTALGLLWLCGYTPQLLMDNVRSNGGHLVPLVAAGDVGSAYTLFSMYHLLDVVNFVFLAAPSFPLFLLILPVRIAKDRTPDPEWLFVLLLALCGLAFVVAFHSSIGMSRDWDLLGPFAVGAVIVGAYGCIRFIKEGDVRRSILAIAVVVSICHTLAWVMSNANSEVSLTRFELLPDNRLWGKQALMDGYDELGAHYRAQSEFSHAIEYYEKYLALDSTNGRIIGNVGHSYLGSGDSALAMTYFQRAAQHGSPDAEVYFRLATSFFKTDTAQAFKIMEHAILLDPNSPTILLNYGTMLVRIRNEYAEGLMYYQRAISVDPSYAVAYKNAGMCLLNLGRSAEARDYFTRFLELDPTDPDGPKIQHIIKQIK
jgi:Tfp pilus assembly protein PilF